MNDRLQGATSGDARAGKQGFGRWIAGRANRKEYWIWIGPILVLDILVAMTAPPLMFLLAIGRLLIFIRRLHDLGWTGWLSVVINLGLSVGNFTFGLLAGPEVGALMTSLMLLVVIVTLGCIPSQPRNNEYGPPPGRRRDDVAETFS